MTILLENVGQQHLRVIRELANVLHIEMREVDNPAAELHRRIETIEHDHTALVTPDWEEIVRQAEVIQY